MVTPITSIGNFDKWLNFKKKKRKKKIDLWGQKVPILRVTDMIVQNPSITLQVNPHILLKFCYIFILLFDHI